MIIPSSPNAEVLTVTIDAGEYEILEVESGRYEGQYMIKMKEFGTLSIPGKPFLPARTFNVAVPPGTDIISVECEPVGSQEIADSHLIRPISRSRGSGLSEAKIRRMKEEWEHNYSTTYSSDEPYPESPAWYRGRGGLRKYTFAKVAYCPFTYYPVSNRLIYHPQVKVNIEYIPSMIDSDKLNTMLLDTKADEQASQILLNYEEAQMWY